MWQNPYASNYNPMAGFQAPPKPLPAPGQTNIGQFSPPGVITPPPNAAPFPTQPELYQAPPGPIQSNQDQLLHMAPTQPLGSMVVNAFDNFKRSIVDSKEDGDNMVLTVKIPTTILKSDPNFSFLFNKQ